VVHPVAAQVTSWVLPLDFIFLFFYARFQVLDEFFSAFWFLLGFS
jgi:hypothetical protein